MISVERMSVLVALVMATAHCSGDDPGAEGEGEVGNVTMELDEESACTWDNPFDSHTFPVMNREIDEVELELRRGNPLTFKRTTFTRADLDALCDPANTNYTDRTLHVGVGLWQYTVYAFGPDDTLTNDTGAPGASGPVWVDSYWPAYIHAVIKAATGDVNATLDVDGASYDDAYGSP